MLAVRFWKPRMEKSGVIRFQSPEECPLALKRDIRPMSMKEFGRDNFSGYNEASLTGLLIEGGDADGLGAETL